MRNPQREVKQWCARHEGLGSMYRGWFILYMEGRGVRWYENLRKGRVFRQAIRAVMYALATLFAIDSADHESVQLFFRDMAVAGCGFVALAGVAQLVVRGLRYLDADENDGKPTSVEEILQVVWITAQMAEDPAYKSDRVGLVATVRLFDWVIHASAEFLLTALIICIAAAAAALVAFGGIF